MSGGHFVFSLILIFTTSNNLEKVIHLYTTYSDSAKQEEHRHIKYDTIL